MSQQLREQQIPRLASAIERPRVEHSLEQVFDHRLLLVCAPAGFGKTTAVAQLARSTPHTVIWHTVDEQERDFPILYQQFTAALQNVFPRLTIDANPPSYEPGELAVSLTNLLRKTPEDKLLIILDDVQNISGSSICEAWLQSFVSLLPSKCHLILISRTPPALSLTEMIARREVVAMSEEELRFTNSEIEELALHMRGARVGASEAEELTNRLQGWPAGIILALRPLPTAVEQLLPTGSVTPEALFDALASSMLDAQPRGLREFLLASSTLARMTPELTANVLGLQNGAAWLGEALEQNMFLSRVPGGLAYHKLFRAFLQRQLRRINETAFVDLHLKAARYFVDQGELVQAFEHFMIGGAADKASAAIDGVLHLYFAQSRAETLLQWNTELQNAGINNAKLLYYAAIIHIDRLNYEAATPELDQAEALFQQEGNGERVAEIQLQRARMNLINGYYLAAIAGAEKLLHRTEDATNLHGRALRVIGFAYLRLGNSDIAVKYLEEALPLSRDNGDKLALSSLLQDLQIVYLRLGRLSEASACLQEVVALRRALGISSLLARALNDLGYHYHQHGDYTQAYATIQEGLSVVARIRNKRIESYLLWSLADLQRDRGSFDEAWQLYSRALEFTGNRDPNLRCNVLINASILRRWQNAWIEAASLAEEAVALAETHSLGIETLVGQAHFWAVQGLQGDASNAFEQLVRLGQALSQKHAVSEAAQVLALCAEVSLAQDNQARARHYLDSAAELINLGASAQPVIAELTYTPKLQGFALANSGSYPHLIARLKHLQKSRVGTAVVTRLEDRLANDYTYSLRILTLGKEKIERDGVPILPGEWRATAARELFFYLLFMGAKRREEISLDFWPDTDPQKVRSNFHTTLYRVRQALGDNIIVFKDDQYMIHPDLDIWCDAHEFEKLVERAQDLSVRDARTEDLYRRAVDLYQGELLPLLDQEWLTPYRENLGELYLEALIGLARCGQARRDFRQALKLFKQALKVDRYREDVHRSIIMCYAEQGEKHKIYAHIQELKKILWTDLRTEPSKDTIHLARTLLS
ncbi:MAG: tetratricopeptide repeat protein [Anaerolineae bacterium]|nr:tetratricopeptide repeat protein [Anaerolineae bacterium]